MIRVADLILRNDHKPALLHANYIYRHENSLLEKILVCHLKQNKEKFRTFVLFLDTKDQQAKIIFHLIIYLFVSTMRHFE